MHFHDTKTNEIVQAKTSFDFSKDWKITGDLQLWIGEAGRAKLFPAPLKRAECSQEVGAASMQGRLYFPIFAPSIRLLLLNTFKICRFTRIIKAPNRRFMPKNNFWRDIRSGAKQSVHRRYFHAEQNFFE